MIAEKLLMVLGCPVCKSGLLVGRDTLVCPNCGSEYCIRAGIPYMVVEERPGDSAESLNATGDKSSESRFERVGRWLYKVLSPPSVVYISGAGKIGRFVSSLGDGAKVVDIGSGSQRRGKDVINLDIFPLPNVDIVFDGRELPIRDATVDGIISTAVLEHVEDPARMVAEMYRILRSGGRALVTVPFIQGFHEAPSDFQRYTMRGLDVLFSKFTKIESGVEDGPSSALAWIIRGWIASFADNRRLHQLLMLVGGWLVQPIKYFDIILAKKRFAHTVAAGLYFIGEKPL